VFIFGGYAALWLYRRCEWRPEFKEKLRTITDNVGREPDLLHPLVAMTLLFGLSTRRWWLDKSGPRSPPCDKL